MLIEYALVSFNVNQPLYFKGSLEEEEVNGMILNKYTAIISLHAIQELESSNPNTRLRLSARNKTVIPNRSIIFGPGHSQFPMKLKANFSK